MGEFNQLDKYMRLLKQCEHIVWLIVIVNICGCDSKSVAQHINPLIEDKGILQQDT